MENPDSKFARGLTKNPNYMMTEEDKTFAMENPGSLFAKGLFG